MTKDLLIKLKELPRLKLLIIVFTVWQYISILGMALMNWPQSLVWLNLGLLTAFIFLSPVYESLLLLVLSIPFYVVIPNARFESLPMWRVLFAILFAVWLVREKKFFLPKRLGGGWNWEGIHFLPWDKYLAWFALVGVLLAFLFGQFRVQAVKEVLFLVNIYMLYLVMVNSLRGKQQIFELIRYTIWSLAIIVTLGFTQLIGTFFGDLNTFWVFWASNITKLYYGAGFTDVALYSNSWFSYSGTTTLRMFSIMPDSQSFAYICLIALCMGTALTRSVFVHVKKWLWSGIRFAGLGILLSGTRAVWVGMVIPFLAVAQAYSQNFQKHLAIKFLVPFVIIFALFAASPFINYGLNLLRVERFQENFFDRAQSIYNLNESSNQGRLAMWGYSAGYFLSHPWGIGLGNFILSATENPEGRSYNELADRHNPRYNLPAKYVSAHSLYLQVMVETGVVGFILFAMFWYTVLKYLWHFLRHYEKTEDFLIYFVAQAFLMVLWVLGAAVFDITLLNDKVLMFFLINLGLAGLIVKRYHEYEEN